VLILNHSLQLQEYRTQEGAVVRTSRIAQVMLREGGEERV